MLKLHTPADSALKRTKLTLKLCTYVQNLLCSSLIQGVLKESEMNIYSTKPSSENLNPN
jgi:hypothetical protein